MKCQIYRKDNSGPRLGLAISAPGIGEIDLPYLSDDAFKKLTVSISGRQLSAILDRDEPPPTAMVEQLLVRSTWWLEIQTQVLYPSWPKETLVLLTAALETIRASSSPPS